MRPRTAIVLIVAAILLMAAASYLSDKRSASAPQVIADSVPGHAALGECVATLSFDDRSTLELRDDGHAEVSGDAPKVGRWSFSDGLYQVTFGGETTAYTRVEVESVACMLIKGTPSAADLLGSWFASAPQPPAPGPDDY